MDFSERRRKMIGPISVTLTTQRIERTTTKTEQNERVNWHLCRFTSLIDCFMKNLNLPQQSSPVPPSSRESLNFSYSSGCLFSLKLTTSSMPASPSSSCPYSSVTCTEEFYSELVLSSPFWGPPKDIDPIRLVPCYSANPF